MGAVAFALVTKFIIKSTEPDFLDVLLEDFKKDSLLNDKIGGYRSYEVNYNDYEAKSDSMNFKIVIYGKNKKYIHYGKAIKNKKKSWMLKSITDSIIEY
ncbi:hypothetical protein D3C78_1664270 [compost metagenome]